MSSTSSNTQEFTYDELMARYVEITRNLAESEVRIDRLSSRAVELERKIGRLEMEKLNFILEWKRALIDNLNAGIFIESEWRAFLNVAGVNGYQAIVDDMEKRFEHYIEAKEQK